MARDFINVERSRSGASHSSLILEFAQQLRRTYELGLKTKTIMDHNHDGEVFTDIETLFGLPVNKGQEVYDLVNGTIGSFEGTFQTSDAKKLGEILG